MSMNSLSQGPNNFQLHNWRWISIDQTILFININELIITYHPPFYLCDIDEFLVFKNIFI